MSKQRRASTAPTSSYATYVGKLQKQMFAGQNVAISKGSVLSLNQMAVYLVDRLSVEAARASRYAKSSTLNMKAGQTSNKLVIAGQLGKVCDAFASQAVLKLVNSTGKADASAAKKKKKNEEAEVEEASVEA